MTNKPKILSEFREKIKILIKHNKYYFKDDSPKISDQEYDNLFRELQQIESQNPDWITPTLGNISYNLSCN